MCKKSNKKEENLVDQAARLKFQKGDVLAIVLVVALAVAVLLCFLPDKDTGAAVAQIYQNGELIKTVELDTSREFTVEGSYTNVITVENGKISITASDCPGEDCVRSSAIEAPGRSIVCLPNGVEVRVVGSSSDVDFVVG